MNELNDVLTPEFQLKLSAFFNDMPDSAYHAENGVVEAFSEKNLSFECACGQWHSVVDCVAIIDTGLTNQAVYGCSNMFAFTLVKATGVFSIKGLKTTAKITCDTEEEAGIVMLGLESRKRRG